MENVVSIESQRRGFLSKASFSISPMKKRLEGSPATKFIYHIIRNKHPVEQSELIYITNLPRRTVQASIEELRNQGLIIEKNSLGYTRKKIYNLMKEEWIYMLNLILIQNFIENRIIKSAIHSNLFHNLNI